LAGVADEESLNTSAIVREWVSFACWS